MLFLPICEETWKKFVYDIHLYKNKHTNKQTNKHTLLYYLRLTILLYKKAGDKTDDVLDVEAARGVDQDALAVAPAQHRQRSGGGAEHRHPLDVRSGLADAPLEGVKAIERRHRACPPSKPGSATVSAIERRSPCMARWSRDFAAGSEIPVSFAASGSG